MIFLCSLLVCFHLFVKFLIFCTYIFFSHEIILNLTTHIKMSEKSFKTVKAKLLECNKLPEPIKEILKVVTLSILFEFVFFLL